jgi:hypothetical protein
MEKKAKLVQLNLRHFPEDLRTEFKILCLRRGRTMTQETIRLYKEELEAARKKGELH